MLRAIVLIYVLVTITSAARISVCQTSGADLRVDPNALNFGQHPVGSASQPLTIAITNFTSSAIRINQVIASGIDFSARPDCGQELAAGAHCSIRVAFTPAIAGERLGTVEIDANDNAGPHFVSLRGTGE